MGTKTKNTINGVEIKKFSSQALSYKVENKPFCIHVTLYSMKHHEIAFKSFLDRIYGAFSLSIETDPSDILLRCTGLTLVKDNIKCIMNDKQMQTLEALCASNNNLKGSSPKSMSISSTVDWLIAEATITIDSTTIPPGLLSLSDEDIRKHVLKIGGEPEIFSTFGLDSSNMSTLVFESWQPKV